MKPSLVAMSTHIRPALIIVLVFAAVKPVVPQPGQDVTSIIISRDLRIREPLGPCDAAVAAGMIATIAEVPAGIEHAGGACNYRIGDLNRNGPRQSLQGKTVREALDYLIREDPRYLWTVSDGVVSFRPIAAATVSDHFLHTAFGPLVLIDGDMGAALTAVLRILRSKPAPVQTTRTPQAARPISTTIPNTNALGALNEIVRRHGSMWWEVRYCEAEPSRRSAILNLWTFDKGGLGMRLDQSFRNTDSPDPCSGSTPR
jgi:hypothetical protein